jgi:hypothetical protein
MQTRTPILLSKFMQVLDINRKHCTKNEHFSMHILFTTVSLLQEDKLNPNKYSEKKINIGNFS